MKKFFILYAFLLSALQLSAQSGPMISGKVTSASDGSAVMYVTVAEIDATNRVVSGTVTDMNGDYVLKIKNPKNKLSISFVGFKTEKLPIGTSKKIDIKLTDDSVMLQGATVTAKRATNDGVFSVANREVSMAVSQINTREFEGISVTSVDDALQGRIAGLDIVGNSGAPGSGSAMRIRGVSTITGNANPLIVVNGIPFDGSTGSDFDFASANEEQYADLLNVNVDDIEDITVLKDAASTAMWGSKGANGVLLITTKKGTKGKTSVTYSYRLSGATQPKGMKMLNGDDYTMLMKQAYFNMSLSGSQIRSDYNHDEYNYNPSFSEYENFNNNTDWVSAVTQNGWTNDHYLTISGGGERAKFRLSGGYYTKSGTNIGQDYTRISTRSQLDYQVSDRLRFTSEFQFTYSDNKKNYNSLLDIAYEKMPNVSIYAQDENGNNTDTYYNILSTSGLDDNQKYLYNPVALAYLAKNEEKDYRILPTVRLSYDILDPAEHSLKYNGYVSFDMNNVKTGRFLPSEVSNLTWDNASVNLASNITSEKLTVSTENNITWQSRFSEVHNLQAYLGLQTASTASHAQTFSSYGHPGNMLVDATSTAYLSGLNNGTSSSRSMGLLGRMHYSYLRRYIFDATYRVDGSTKFGAANRYGVFPGLSAKWIISDEPFMKNVSKVLTLLAIRPSWGIAGRQPSDNYSQYSTYSADSYGYMGQSAVYPTRIQLTNLRWEKVTSTNLGADLELWNGMISANFDWYHKRTTDLLFDDLSISPTSGFATLTSKNVGTMDNDGWEFSFNTSKLIKAGKFSLDFNFNIASNANKIIDLDEAVMNKYNDAANTIGNGVYLTRIQPNNSYGSIYGFRYKGVYQYSYDNYKTGNQENAPVARDANSNVMLDYDGNPKQMYYRYKSTKSAFQGGDAIYEDVNHDGSIDEYDVVYLGNSNPKLTGGFGSNIRYGNFSMNLFCNFRYGNKIINYARMQAENMYTDNNQCVTTNWRWRKEGDVTDVPRAVYKQGYNWLGSDRYVEDGSFVRLKYITFRYTVPSKVVKNYGLNQLNFYMTINNLLCLDKYSGADPEVSYSSSSLGVSMDKSATPRSKEWTFGITAIF